MTADTCTVVILSVGGTVIFILLAVVSYAVAHASLESKIRRMFREMFKEAIAKHEKDKVSDTKGYDSTARQPING